VYNEYINSWVLNKGKEAVMNAKKLFNKEVLDAQGNTIGKVDDIYVDMDKGVVVHIVVKAGLLKKYDIKLDKIATIGDKIILKVKKDELAQG
jgi:sporulation protein YlmC with PRC-barrel domain